MSVCRSSLFPRCWSSGGTEQRRNDQMGWPHGHVCRHVKSVYALIAKAAAVKVQITFRCRDLMCVTSVPCQYGSVWDRERCRYWTLKHFLGNSLETCSVQLHASLPVASSALGAYSAPCSPPLNFLYFLSGHSSSENPKKDGLKPWVNAATALTARGQKRSTNLFSSLHCAFSHPS